MIAHEERRRQARRWCPGRVEAFEKMAKCECGS